MCAEVQHQIFPSVGDVAGQLIEVQKRRAQSCLEPAETLRLYAGLVLSSVIGVQHP
jgi:hypothetical protein